MELAFMMMFVVYVVEMVVLVQGVQTPLHVTMTHLQPLMMDRV
jgi:hypothetical protein